MNIKILLIVMTTFCLKTILAQNEEIQWELQYHETFDSQIQEPSNWIEDTYGDDSPWHVGPFDEDGEYFYDEYGERFQTALNKFRSFRKSFTYGENDWLTIELYGRDQDKDGNPESGGMFVTENGKVNLIVPSHYDGAIIRNTEELPELYRIQITVTNIEFGGDKNDDGNWIENGKYNGYDGDEKTDPWILNSLGNGEDAINENGLYFLCITDYPNPAPHNNIFIHHHRKVALDTDFNDYNNWSWSRVYNPNIGDFERDGNGYVGMIWLQGDDFGSDNNGNKFSSWTTQGWKTGTYFIDKYIHDETYLFTIERTHDSYTMSVSGKFYYGGETTYSKRREFLEEPIVWHYNQSTDYDGRYNQVKEYNGKNYDTWPANTIYPDYFFFGDPHINFYEGTAQYDDLKLWIGNIVSDIAADDKVLSDQSSVYPNPFNNKTNIRVGINKESIIGIKIYNILGQLVYEKMPQRYSPREHIFSWNPELNLASGMYICNIVVKSDNILKSHSFKILKTK